MQKKVSFIVIIVLASIITTFTLAQQNELESITTFGTWEGTFSADNSIDSFVINIEEGQAMAINIVALSASLIPDFTVYDSNGNPIAVIEDALDNETNRISFPSPGQYRIDVKSQFDTVGDYIVKTRPLKPYTENAIFLPANVALNESFAEDAAIQRFNFASDPEEVSTVIIYGEDFQPGVVAEIRNLQTAENVGVINTPAQASVYCLPAGRDNYRLEVFRKDNAEISNYNIAISTESNNFCDSAEISDFAASLPQVEISDLEIVDVTSPIGNFANPETVLDVDEPLDVENNLAVVDATDNNDDLINVDLVQTDGLNILTVDLNLDDNNTGVLEVLPDTDSLLTVDVLSQDDNNNQNSLITLDVTGDDTDLLNIDVLNNVDQNLLNIDVTANDDNSLLTLDVTSDDEPLASLDIPTDSTSIDDILLLEIVDGNDSDNALLTLDISTTDDSLIDLDVLTDDRESLLAVDVISDDENNLAVVDATDNNDDLINVDLVQTDGLNILTVDLNLDDNNTGVLEVLPDTNSLLTVDVLSQDDNNNQNSLITLDVTGDDTDLLNIDVLNNVDQNLLNIDVTASDDNSLLTLDVTSDDEPLASLDIPTDSTSIDDILLLEIVDGSDSDNALLTLDISTTDDSLIDLDVLTDDGESLLAVDVIADDQNNLAVVDATDNNDDLINVDLVQTDGLNILTVDLNLDDNNTGVLEVLPDTDSLLTVDVLSQDDNNNQNSLITLDVTGDDTDLLNIDVLNNVDQNLLNIDVTANDDNSLLTLDVTSDDEPLASLDIPTDSTSIDDILLLEIVDGNDSDNALLTLDISTTDDSLIDLDVLTDDGESLLAVDVIADDENNLNIIETDVLASLTNNSTDTAGECHANSNNQSAKVNIRHLPTTAGSILTSIDTNETLHILGQTRNNTWVQAELSDGRTGFIATSVLDFVDACATIDLPYIWVDETEILRLEIDAGLVNIADVNADLLAGVEGIVINGDGSITDLTSNTLVNSDGTSVNLNEINNTVNEITNTNVNVDTNVNVNTNVNNVADTNASADNSGVSVSVDVGDDGDDDVSVSTKDNDVKVDIPDLGLGG